jgi:hypothetical protein
MDANFRMPGDAEAAAAVAGMQDVYGRSPVEHAVGDWISWHAADGIRSGRIEAISGEVHLVMQADGRLANVSPSQIARA